MCVQEAPELAEAPAEAEAEADSEPLLAGAAAEEAAPPFKQLLSPDHLLSICHFSHYKHTEYLPLSPRVKGPDKALSPLERSVRERPS